MKRSRLRPLFHIANPFNRETRRKIGSQAVSQSQAIVATGILVVAVTWLVAGAMIYQIRNSAIADAGEELSTLDQLLTADTVRIFDSTDMILDGIIEDLTQMGVRTSASLRAMSLSSSVRNTLIDRVEVAEHIGTITILSPEGDLLTYSKPGPTPTVNVFDREYFQEMVANPHVPFALGSPISSRFSGDLSIHYAIPMLGSEGEFIGAVVAILPLDYFNELYRSLQIGTGGAISLWREDGTMLARYPSFPGVGRRFDLDMYRSIVPSSVPQIYQTENSLGGLEGVPRIVAAKRPESYPITVNVSFNRDLVLAPWWTTSSYVVLAASMLTILTGLIIWALLKNFRDLESLRVALNERQMEIDRRKEIEEQLRQSQKLEAVGQLTSGIAHDFNNILTVVIGHLDVVRRGVGAAATPAVAKSIDRASTSARKAADLTHRLLAFARKQRLDPANIDVEQLLEDMTGILGRTLGENIEIEVERTGGVWSVFADKNQLESVLVNLAINSRDAMEGQGTIKLRAHNTHIPHRLAGGDYDGMSGDFVAISITDTGSGMPPEVLERAFEPFYSTKGVGKGSGLGLSQVYGFSKQSGGSAIIESDLGVGTTVTVYLPRAEAEEDTIQLPDVGDYKRGNRETVLVVDDNADLRDIAVTMLSDLNYKVLVAEDGAEALTILKLNQVDVLLADIGLPGMSGSELGKQAPTIRPGIQVVYMTGYAMDEIGEGSGIPRDRVLIKPVSFRGVSEKMNEVLSGERIKAAG